VAGLPEGTLTFMLTDLEGSTRIWEADPGVMRDAMAQHDAIVYGSVERNSGTMVESGREGDSVLAVFVRAHDAAACALDIQRAFHSAVWPGDLKLKIRVALHTGEVELRGNHYFGPPLNRCARVLALCHGGQTAVTRATREVLVEDAPSGVELTDLGHHRLKDLKRIEQVFQLTDRARPEQFPPLRARREYQTNLPTALTSFIGRRRELSAIRELHARNRLLTLAGPGGAGKTRLAKQLVLEVADDMPGGAWLVDLAPVSDPQLVVQTTATVLDLEAQQGRALEDTLAEYCARQPMLLVLDNCEHLLQACAELAETLLARCPDLRIVTTSREPLNVQGEAVWRVPSLVEAESIELFTDRARSRSPGLDDAVSDRATVATICGRLDGIPLAIELAAARTATMSEDDILRRLEVGFGVLRGGSRTAQPRQQTLEATIDWSYELLAPDERALLRRLAVFAGRFSLDAAEAVCANRDLPRESIFEHLGQLVAKSLVQRADDRYAFLETIRTYAHAKLAAAGETATLSRAHASYFLELAVSRRPGKLAAWLDALEFDHDNLRAALRWCIESDPEMGARLAAAMTEFWLLRGFASEARDVLEQLSTRLPPASPLRPRARMDSGLFAYVHGDMENANVRLDDGLASARSAADPALVTRGLILRGGAAQAQGDLVAARDALEEALSIARSTGDRRQEIEVLHHFGVLAALRGDLAGALTRFAESLELRRQLGTRHESSITLAMSAAASMLRSDLPAARAAIVEALEIGLALRDRRTAWSLDILACLAALGGEAERALRLGGAAEAMFESTGQRPPPLWGEVTKPLMARAREHLGAEDSLRAWQSGRALTFEPALHYALEGENVTAGPSF
jgi:predicted ATPase/class 3 adenylate cyclase